MLDLEVLVRILEFIESMKWIIERVNRLLDTAVSDTVVFEQVTRGLDIFRAFCSPTFGHRFVALGCTGDHNLGGNKQIFGQLISQTDLCNPAT